jgi:hypothetical protein
MAGRSRRPGRSRIWHLSVTWCGGRRATFMARKALAEIGLALFVVLALGGMLYFLSVTLATAPLFDDVAPEAMGPGYPP